MSVEKKIDQVTDDVIVSLHYVLTVDGEQIDTSREDSPIDFLQGHNNIIPGLEHQLYGMKVGDKKEVTVSPKDGYGERAAEDIKDVPRSEFPDDIPLKPGVYLQVEDKDGFLEEATIVEVGKDTVKLDFNHPLAGKELHFQVEVVDLRAATAEELDHGHPHSPGGHHH